MKSWKKILLYPALALSLLGKADAQTYRVTELSSFPRKGIANAKVVFDKDSLRLMTYTNNEGYYDPNQVTSVHDNINEQSKLAKIASVQKGISFSSLENATLTIYNILGQEIFNAKGNNIIWNMQNKHNQRVAQGVYLYKLEDNTKVEYGKIIPHDNFVDLSLNRYVQEKNKKQNVAGSFSKANLSKGSVGTAGSNVSCVDT